MARTPNYNLELIDFNKIPWHTKEHDNWRSIDAIFANFITVNQMQGVWQNATAVTVGQRFVDAEAGTILTVLIAHTTASTGLFSADRTANPTYWELFSDVALAESWASSLAGLVNSVDYSSKAYAVGTVTQLPDGSAKRWAVEVEDTEVISGSYSALHHATKAAASAVSSAADAVSTAADLVSTNQDTIDTAADLVLTNADIVLTHADEVLTRADTVLTAADVVSTNADVVTAANSASVATAAAQGWGAVTTITGATTNLEIADARDYYILDATSNTITINLPAIGSSDGLLFGFQVSNVDNAISIVRDGSDKINGSASNYSGLTAVGQVIHFIADDATADNWLATIVSQSPDATTSVKGIASFSSDNFAVSSGAVTIKDGGVVTDEIADNAVTLAKMASGTDGNIISFDSSGNPVAITTGTDGQVLTSAGAGAQPAFEDAGGGDMVLLSTTNASTASTVDLTGNFTSTYSSYMVRGVDIFTSNSTETLTMQVIFDSTAITGSVYYGHLVRSDRTSNDYSGQAMSATTAFNIINQLSSASTQGTGFVLNVLNAPATSNSYKFFTWNGMSAEGWSINYGAGGVNDATDSDLTGLRFLMSAGTVSGKFLLYGIK